MEMLHAGVKILQTIVNFLGGGMIVLGLITFFQGQGDSNPASKLMGIMQLLGGGGIVLVANTLIPMLSNLA